MSTLTTEDFTSIVINQSPLLDIRAPIEFSKGAFPNAINIPIMDDEERRLIGIKYKEDGNQAAVSLGKELIAGELQEQRVAKWMAFIKKHPDAYLYCFRGGQRSAITQMWLDEAGIKITRLKGGYKQFRNFLMSRSIDITSKIDTIILGGRTGSGKTILLKKIQNAIDLEALANHRGSSFGNFINSQPSQIDFENNLAYKLIQFNEKKYKNLVIEHESHNIGRNFIPKPIYNNFKKGKLILLQTPLVERVDITYNEYVTSAITSYTKEFKENGLQMWADDVINSLTRIQKRLGSELFLELKSIFQDAYSKHSSIESEVLYKKWIEKLLTNYYDPMYDYQIEKSELCVIFKGNSEAVLSFLSNY